MIDCICGGHPLFSSRFGIGYVYCDTCGAKTMTGTFMAVEAMWHAMYAIAYADGECQSAPTNEGRDTWKMTRSHRDS